MTATQDAFWDLLSRSRLEYISEEKSLGTETPNESALSVTARMLGSVGNLLKASLAVLSLNSHCRSHWYKSKYLISTRCEANKSYLGCEDGSV